MPTGNVYKCYLDKALKKVTRKDDKNKGRVRYTEVYDSKLPQLPNILERNWRVMVESDI